MSQPPDFQNSPTPDDPRLPKINQAIRLAWIAGIFSGVLTLVVTLVVMSNPQVAQQTGFNAWNLIDVVLIFGLSFGIFMKSRVCAVAMFAYFVVSKIIQIAGGFFNPAGIFVAIAFGYAYFEGIRGTFAYHRVMKERNQT
jgi:serine/threonine-protein kinase